MSDEEWMRQHKGEFIKRVGYVWECGDDECRCEQASIVAYYRNKVDPRFRVPVHEWSGEFYTTGDGEPGHADEELAAKRRELERDDPELAAAIEWQKVWTPG